MYCKYCGYKLEKKSKFCPNCGKQLIEDTKPNKTTESVEKKTAHNNVTPKRQHHKLIISLLIVVIVLMAGWLGWWKYQHPSLKKAVPGSIYKVTISTKYDGKKITGGVGYFIFTKDGQYALVDTKKEATAFENEDYKQAAKNWEDDQTRYKYHVENNKVIDMHYYVPGTSEDEHRKLTVNNIDRTHLTTTFKNNESAIGADIPKNSHVKFVKIGETKS
ncbi:zinc ribbon domain-containing protein [uncultured Limosilactobacillus sp.]|uniref:zinc ribbon domain-containing protein n=1 Tax=uncultured Limosilactobacillus sp. TaxID=2837629 RepID=UPI0025D0875D|nr:zinc ribbon domain-containing protein [uncultured Limosilactobacillus sp.]